MKLCRCFSHPIGIGFILGELNLALVFLLFQFIFHRKDNFPPVIIVFFLSMVLLSLLISKGTIKTLKDVFLLSLFLGLTFIITDWIALQFLPPSREIRDLWDHIAPYYAAFRIGLSLSIGCFAGGFISLKVSKKIK